MSYKLDYISRLFQRTSSKRIEHYVITRIWHLLDNYDVKMAPQQYVSRELAQYALTDVYFPQFGIHVEVNEPAHYESEERIQRDLKRQQEIEINTGHQIIAIDCRKDILGIHSQISDLIKTIRSEIVKQTALGIFKPWQPESEHNPVYWKGNKKIRISDEITLNTIQDICLLFDADYKKTKRGFLNRGGISNPKNNNQMIWWPSERPRSGWLNNFDENNGTITETHTESKKKFDHYHFHEKGTYIRIVFFHYKDVLGLSSYKFVGIFTNDRVRSTPEIGTIWKRIGVELNLETNEFL